MSDPSRQTEQPTGNRPADLLFVFNEAELRVLSEALARYTPYQLADRQVRNAVWWELMAGWRAMTGRDQLGEQQES